MSLNTLIKNTATLNLIKTISFYIIAITAIFLLDKISPSGPCTPGLGILLFMLLIPLVFILLCINLYKIFNGDKSRWYSVALHLGMLLLFILLR